ncbi:MAG: RNA-binding S4 domain-containing protein [Kosmotoga sp.]|nr:MAG: RNA-binding S4 domain-containing protein [Kosmotoga sp.]
MRLDKFLKVNRIIKRRVVAKRAIENGYVLRNGQNTKAGTDINPGDVITVNFPNRKLKVAVTEDFGVRFLSETNH